jgi:hypothetical protein
MRATMAKITTAATVNGLFIACIDHLEREKRGWRGLSQGAPTSHSQQAKPPGKLAEAA